MKDYTEVFVGIDTSKLRNAIAIAEQGRQGEIRYLGEIDNTPEAARKSVAKLVHGYEKLLFCYEARPTGYGLHWWLMELGQSNNVVAPSLIPKRPGDRVKTNRRDAQSLAKLLLAGDLTDDKRGSPYLGEPVYRVHLKSPVFYENYNGSSALMALP